jgi:hypothetical protein
MKMVECIGDEVFARPKGEIGSKVTQKNQASLNNENKGRNKHKWGQGKLGPLNYKEKLMSKELPVKKVI